MASVCTSPDGVTWTRHGVPAGADSLFLLYKVAFGDGLWVALGSQDSGFSGMTAVSSDGGSTWTGGFMNHWNASPFGNYVSADIAYGDGVFVVVGNASNTGDWPLVQTSPDGITWTDRSSPMDTFALGSPPGFAWAIDWNGSEFVVVGQGGTHSGFFSADVQAMSSPDGVTWTSNGHGFPWGDAADKIGEARGGLLWSDLLGGWVLVNGNAEGYGNTASSADGAAWSVVAALPDISFPIASPSSLCGLAESSDFIVAAVPPSIDNTPYPDSVLIGSANGAVWSILTTPWNVDGDIATFKGVAYGDEKFVTIGNDPSGDTTKYLRSVDDGTTWTDEAFPTGFSAFGIRYADGQFMAVGQFEYSTATGWHVGSIAKQ